MEYEKTPCPTCKGSGVGKIVEYIDEKGNVQRDVYPCTNCRGTGWKLTPKPGPYKY